MAVGEGAGGGAAPSVHNRPFIVPAACPCRPCHPAAAPSQPFVSQQQAVEMQEQVWSVQ